MDASLAHDRRRGRRRPDRHARPRRDALQVDRRRVRERLTRLRVRLREVERTRTIQRRRRLEVPYPTVALAGYTNSGKSTLMNALTDAGVVVADCPFSTLDPTIRRLRLPGGANVMLADTVGFIHRLPHMLVEAFKATLEEVARRASFCMWWIRARRRRPNRSRWWTGCSRRSARAPRPE